MDAYIGYVEKYNRPDTAFHKFWEDKGIPISAIDNYYLHPYDNSITDVPHVTVKVPTAGGKTFIACNALSTIFRHLPVEKPKVVAVRSFRYDSETDLQKSEQPVAPLPAEDRQPFRECRVRCRQRSGTVRAWHRADGNPRATDYFRVERAVVCR